MPGHALDDGADLLHLVLDIVGRHETEVGFVGHPSGDPSPSRADIAMTNSIRDAVKLIDVTLHDHIIVTPSDAFSFREKGLI